MSILLEAGPGLFVEDGPKPETPAALDPVPVEEPLTASYWTAMQGVVEVASEALRRIDALSGASGGLQGRFVGVLLKAPDEGGQRACKFFVDRTRRAVSAKIYKVGVVDGDYVVAVIFDRERGVVDAFSDRSRDDEKRDPLYLRHT
jgi:hypothetical protein